VHHTVLKRITLYCAVCYCRTHAGGYGEFAVADERSVMHIPPSFAGDMAKAAALPETWLTAYQLIHFVGKTQPGDVVLVHAAGSGVGLAACQLLKAHGAVPIATARTAEKLVVAQDHGAEHTIDTKVEADWASKVKELTGGQGANVILDPVGGSYSKQNADALARDGRWVVYGLMGGRELEAASFMGTVLAKRATLVGTTLRSRTLEYKGELVNALVKDAFPKFEDGTFRPIVDRVFSLSQAGEAHAYMEANSNTGKILLKVLANL